MKRKGVPPSSAGIPAVWLCGWHLGYLNICLRVSFYRRKRGTEPALEGLGGLCQSRAELGSPPQSKHARKTHRRQPFMTEVASHVLMDGNCLTNDHKAIMPAAVSKKPHPHLQAGSQHLGKGFLVRPPRA